MVKKSLIRKTIKLVREGYGRKVISDELKIPEWQARELQIAAEALIAMDVKPKSVAQPKTSKNTDRELHVVLSDLHFPYHDEQAVKLALEFCEREQPDVVHLLGDLVDFYNISRFNKDPNRKLSLQDELDQVTDFLYTMREMLPKAKLIYYEGNHEERLKKYLWSQSPELHSLRVLDLKSLLQLDDLNIEFFDYNTYNKHKHLVFFHGHLISKWSGYTAKREMETVGGSIIHGHTHRLGSSFQTTFSGAHVAYENGCLCNLNPEYVRGTPNWQLGFSTVCFVNNQFFVVQVPIINYSYIWNGQLYS